MPVATLVAVVLVAAVPVAAVLVAAVPVAAAAVEVAAVCQSGFSSLCCFLFLWRPQYDTKRFLGASLFPGNTKLFH